MRHDKLREWAHDTSRPEDPVVPHQARADEFQTPSLKKDPEFFDENEVDEREEYDFDAPDREEDEGRQNDYEMDEFEIKARAMGWVPKEQWRGNPDDWTSAKRFVQTGEMIQANRALHQKVDHLEKDFETRLNNVRMIHEAQLKLNLERLRAERDEAVEMADTEKYRALNQQIENLERQGLQQGPLSNAPPNVQSEPAMQAAPMGQPSPQTQATQSPVDMSQAVRNVAEHPTVQQWRQKNPWIEQQTPKTAYAERVFLNYIQQNINNPSATIEQGLDMVEKAVAREFPSTNPNQQRPSMSSRSNRPSPRAANITLSMNDLTREERLVWQTMGKSFKNQAEFLRAVADDRASKQNG